MIHIAFEVTDEPPRLIVTEKMPYAIDAVWRAQTEALYVQQWWAPLGYQNVDISLATDEGDGWRVVQRDPQGNQFSFYGKVEKFVPTEVLAITLTSELFPDSSIRLVQRFAGEGQRTLVTSTYEFQNDEDRDGYLDLGGLERLRGASVRLDALLAQMTGAT